MAHLYGAGKEGERGGRTDVAVVCLQTPALCSSCHRQPNNFKPHAAAVTLITSALLDTNPETMKFVRNIG